MKITPSIEKYILHWGEMGTRWGVNRSVSQIHALLYLAPAPLNAEQITGLLGIARSNVSTSLKELQGWRLVKVNHVLGDRRDHFIAIDDTWQMLLTIVEERKKREIDPTLTMLRQCVLEMQDDVDTSPEVKLKISNMLDFIATLNTWFDQVKGLPTTTLGSLLKLGEKVARFIPKTKA